MADAFIEGKFIRYAPEGSKETRLVGPGTMEVSDFNFEMKGPRQPGFLAGLFGVVFAVLGVAFVIAAVMYLADNKIIDFMRIRKGPMFIGVMGLVFIVLGWVAGGWIADKLFTRMAVLNVETKKIKSLWISNNNSIIFSYSDGSKPSGCMFMPSDPINLKYFEKFVTIRPSRS
ncbi:hypothetical protein KKF34_19080 [Myxococcota bacterium]|nr:hypothetical protein [Myxococcota bacterium]MBU1382843.1 hypothetical protein [Myxococcota bacterium]MBU1498992.1 hypothetical protein [Myxococcota bacterium]